MPIRPFQPADEDAVVELWHRSGLVRPPSGGNDPRKDIARRMAALPQRGTRDSGLGTAASAAVRSTNAAVPPSLAFYRAIGFTVDDVISMGRRLEED